MACLPDSTYSMTFVMVWEDWIYIFKTPIRGFASLGFCFIL